MRLALSTPIRPEPAVCASASAGVQALKSKKQQLV
jgi:hypothetical protein